MYKPLTEWRKKFLGPQVEKITISNKLDDDPLFILTSQYGFSATMEKVNRAQAFQNQDRQDTQSQKVSTKGQFSPDSRSVSSPVVPGVPFAGSAILPF